jgi:hypothetical protein
MRRTIYSLSLCAVIIIFISCKSSLTSQNDITSGKLGFSVDTLKFGVVPIGVSKSVDLQLTNIGTSAITVSNITAASSNSPYTVSGLPITLQPNAKQVVTVSFTAQTAGPYIESFTVSSSDGTYHFYAVDTVVSGGNDPVVYSFVVLGCNRVDKGDYNASTNPSSANLEQLNRTFADMAALTPKPDLFFAMGDIVLGESDSITLASQLIAWKAVWEASAAKAAGIELVAVTGNHETMDKNKIPQPYGEQAWSAIMAPYMTRGGNGPVPHAGDPDKLTTDQSKLTYSFDYKDAHFIVMSTDPAGLVSQPPANWIASDIQAAHNNSAIKHIFAVGHKPAYSFDNATGNGLVATTRDIIWPAMEAARGEAMFAAHNHIYKSSQPTGHTWMVIAGNGGSSLEAAAQPNFGFVLVQVLKSGTVIEKSYARNFSTYIAPSPVDTYPTTLRDSNVISWK